MSIELTQYVEFETHLEIDEGGFSYCGEHWIAEDVTFQMDAQEVVDQLCDEEKSQLKEALGPVPALPVGEMPVDVIYDQLTEAQCAILFNKLLKYRKYNPKGTSILKLNDAMADCMAAQDKEI